jgi:tripartite ATP-independent transporter DctM subunit
MAAWATLSIGLGLLLALFLTGLPIFIAFLVINITGVILVLGTAGFGLFANSIFETTNTATFAAVPLFLLLGELLFRSGTIDHLFQSVDKLIGRVNGRQYFLCVSLSTIFGALSGSAMGVAAMMGRSLYPVMIAQGYDRRLSTGLILAGASLAPIIPPSVLVIIIATLADVSVAKLLIAGIIPGFVLAALFMGYALTRVAFDASLAPGRADTESVPLSEKLLAVARMAPFGIIIFCVMGLILLGIATPSESAATGVVGALITAAYYGRLSWRMLAESIASAAFVTSMILVIIASANMFGQLLAFTGATREVVRAITSLDLHPYLLLLLMMLIPLVLCMFIDQVALLLIIVPIYQPLVGSLGFDPVWFWLMMLLNLTVGGISPPFGYTMFAFKGGAPDVPLADIFAASWPFVVLFMIGILLVAMFPSLATYLPSLI